MSPIRVPLFLIPARCRGASRFVVFSPLPVCASLVFLPAESSYGFVWGHERSTTFPWVSSRPVQLGYDRALRGACLECIRCVARVVPSAAGLSRLLLCVFVG
jgi:hypothetical protein